ncbi:hypothetical protein [Nocardioides cynanchi]|uniref:hypothetical protein n=1 Tax=Nocardioides cynanchi TaxID=2558918 RepID=UPI00124511DE|nr:hypothetical protein [Nocardioides cynanchi]
MNRFRTTAVAFVSTLAIGSFAVTAVPAAFADDGSTDATCTTAQAHVDKATAKWEVLQAKYAAHPTKKVKKAKKAQAQRVAHATAQLDSCLAGLPV